MIPSLLSFLALLAPASAQSPEEEWRTIRTAHYRLHYPADAEEWALLLAERLEGIRERVAAEVGYAPTQVVDIVVMDPWAAANGFAIPFLNGPRMGVFPTAPGAAAGIGHYRSWAEDLVVHEDAHLVHLLRPSRNPGLRFAGEFLLGVGPVSMLSPAWVIEGYATVVEGRLTGLGRPDSDLRASFLRGLALDGQFPTYGQLDNPGRWGGGAYRYLVGSAYLEWLDARSDRGLPDLWAAMTAREVRSFDEAFQRVFGDDPAALYARFAAEVTAEALAVEAIRPQDGGTLWQDLSWSTGAPAVSPDGTKVAAVLWQKQGPPRLVAWETGPNTEAWEAWLEREQELREEDPEDPAAIPPRAFEREPAAERVMGGRSPSSLRWLDDTRVLFTDERLDRVGDAVPDLFIWDTESGRVRGVTRGAHVRDADPRGDRAYGVRSQGGVAQLVRVDLDTGVTTSLNEGDPTVVLDQPRVSPDGARLAWLENAGQWRVRVQALDAQGRLSGEPADVALPPGSEPLSFAWRPDGAGLIASLGRAGFVELYDLPLEGEEIRQITRSRGGAYAPAPTPDGEAVFYLMPDWEGRDVHRIALPAAPGAASIPDDAAIRDALGLRTGIVKPPSPPPAPPLPIQPELAPHPYRLGRPELRLIAGTQLGPSEIAGHLGLWAGDVVGRHELVAFASSLDDQAPFTAGRAAFTWRGLPLHLRLDVASFAFGDAPLLASADATWYQLWRGGRLTLSGGVWQAGFPDFDHRGSSFAGSVSHRQWLGGSWVRGGLETAASLDIDRDPQVEADLSLAAGGASGFALGASAGGGWTERGYFQLGGLPPALYPELYPDPVLAAPGLAPGADSAQGYARLRLDAELGSELSLFAERHQLASSRPFTSWQPGWTRVGLDLDLTTPPQPLGRIPAMNLLFGASCTLEDLDGWRQRPCLTADHWGAWMGLLIRPGRMTIYPTYPTAP